MVKEKNFTVVKYNVKNKEMINYFTQTALLSNNLTNVNIYHQRQWFFYTQNLYYEQNPKEDFKPYKYDSKLIDELKEYMIKYNTKQILKGKKEVDFIKYGLDLHFLHYYFKETNQVDYNHCGLSAQTKTGGFEHVVMSEQLRTVYKKRHRRIEHLFYILSNHVLEFCLENNVSKLALAKNKGWKQNYDHGKKNNQNFIHIPYRSFYQKITDKLTKHGIEVIEQEESYTSQASALDLDPIPVYGDDVSDNCFSGKRYGKNNRLYKTSNGVTINADMNGALNILRKAFPEVEIELDDLEYMKNPKVLKNMQA